jgi:uncharacterized protein
MDRTAAITALKHHASAIKAMGATSLYVFGSTVRDEAKETSDLDLFIDYDFQAGDGFKAHNLGAGVGYRW